MQEEQQIDARIGNRFWEKRSSHGRNPIFATPDDLWNACVEYFVYVDDNPLQEQKINFYQGEASKENINKMQAMTLDGLTIFLGIAPSTWYDYKEKKDFYEVTTRVSQIIKHQKFTGAAADLLNPNIIARDLGLSDKKEITADVKTQGHVTQVQFASLEDWEAAGEQAQESINKAHEQLMPEGKE